MSDTLVIRGAREQDVRYEVDFELVLANSDLSIVLAPQLGL